MLDVVNVAKSFKAIHAVQDVSFTVQPGEIVGLLGPNGAGKTTTVSMVAGIIAPDRGSVLIDGAPLARDDDPRKRRIGLVPQDLALIDELSASDNLAYAGGLLGLGGRHFAGRAATALEFVGLADRATSKVGTFSGGMKRRLNLAAGMLHDPGLLLLDEPTVGVDPQSRNAIFDAIETLRAHGTAIVYTTHYMEEAERLCDRLVIVDHGQVVASGTVAELATRLPHGDVLHIELKDPECELRFADLAKLPAIDHVVRNGAHITVQVASLAAGTAAVTAYLAAHAVAIASIASVRPDLDEIFLTLTGRSLRD